MGVERYIIVPTMDKEKIDKLVKTIGDICEAFNNPEVISMYKELCGQYEDIRLPFKSKGICNALKKCLVSHRFVDAAKLMECLSCENGNSQLIFKAGFQVLENHPNMTPEKMLLLMCHIICLNCLYRSEVALEATVYFIKHRRFEHAQNCIKEIETAKWRSNMRTDPLIEGLLKAYDGLLNYVEWAKLKLDDSFDNLDVRQQNMKKVSDKAIATFLGLLSQKGPWDIFMVKLIEILEYYKRLNEAELALIRYIDTNPAHIHAHLYLYEFYLKHNYEQEQWIKCLKKIIEICPSDSRVLDYVVACKGNKMAECIDLLFNYLNYASNKDDLKAWSILVDLLMGILKRNVGKELQSLKDTWQQYNSFWPAYQFSVTSTKLTNGKSAELAFLKATALYVLENEKGDHPFVCKVQRTLSSMPYPDLKSKLSENLSTIDKLKASVSRKRKLSNQDSDS